MDRMKTHAGLACLILALSACGGGGGGGSKSPTPSTPAPPVPVPTASLTAQTEAMPLQAAWLDETSLTITGSVNWTDVPAGVYIVATDLGSLLGPGKTKLVQSTGSYTLTMGGDPAVAPGNYSGSVKVQVCQDSACTKPFNNTATTLSYSLVVSSIDEWSTYQRTPGHDAYVPITLNSARFALKWQWNTTDSLGAPLFEQGPNQPAVTDGNAVYTSTGSIRAEGYLFAVSKVTGKSLWSKSLGLSYMTNPPAVKDGVVYVATSGLLSTGGESGWSNSFLWAFNATDGGLLFKAPYPTYWTWPHFLAPTPHDGTVYINGGKNTLETFAFDAVTGGLKWQVEVADGAVGSTTPTLAGAFVFDALPSHVQVLKAASGLNEAVLPVAYGIDPSTTYGSAAVATDRGSILTLSGSTSLITPNTPRLAFGAKRALNRFSLMPLAATSWSTQPLYDGSPVAANGVVYAYRYDPAQLDALDEATGQVLWSWKPTAAEGTYFQENMIVTKNLLFFSTDKGLQALDLKTRSLVWKLALPGCVDCYGNISMSADRILMITSGWGITAISLR